MSRIVLATLNARYIHSSLGLRYLYANLGALRDDAEIQEYIIGQRPVDIAEKILQANPAIIGFGLYIWNVEQSSQVISIVRTLRPGITIIVGGPEASYETEALPCLEDVDYLISGQADLLFAELCSAVLTGTASYPKLLDAPAFRLEQIQLPYAFYNDEDVSNRIIYVEASRGCPFKCEFCLSALDKTAWPFDLELFLQQMDLLYRRGVRHFKFVDRTFNLKPASSVRIMEFFLQRMDEKLFLHFELIPDHLPEQLREIIRRFPEGSLQFEIGMQSFNPQVQQLISRRQDNEKSEQNIRFLREHTSAHLHVDLIIGLPGEDMESLASGFDRLVAMGSHEIQVGVLKRLRGTPIIRHTQAYRLKFNPSPPYNVLSTREIDFPLMQRLTRFARYWDMVGNSGRFRAALPLLLGEAPFARFLAFSDWLYRKTGQTHRIALPRLFNLLHAGLLEVGGGDEEEVNRALCGDYTACGLKGRPAFLADSEEYERQHSGFARRQGRHLS